MKIKQTTSLGPLYKYIDKINMEIEKKRRNSSINFNKRTVCIEISKKKQKHKKREIISIDSDYMNEF